MSILQKEAIRGAAGQSSLTEVASVKLLLDTDQGAAVELSVNPETGATAMLRRATDDNLSYATELWVTTESGVTGDVVACAKLGTLDARVEGVNSADSDTAIAVGDLLTFKAIAAINNLYYDAAQSCLCKAVTGDVVAAVALEAVSSGAAPGLAKVRLVPQITKV